jgi:hypothetical protein
MFKTEHAMKTKKIPTTPALEDSASTATAPVVDTPTSAAVPAPAMVPAHAQMMMPPAMIPSFFNPYMLGTMPGLPMGMPGFNMPLAHMPGSSPHKERSSSPVSMPGGVHGFCEAYGLNKDDEIGLEWLGFVLGDKLDEVSEQEYKDAGFKPLAWKRVIKAYKRLKRENHV